jgi:hypothetical protein
MFSKHFYERTWYISLCPIIGLDDDVKVRVQAHIFASVHFLCMNLYVTSVPVCFSAPFSVWSSPTSCWGTPYSDFYCGSLIEKSPGPNRNSCLLVYPKVAKSQSKNLNASVWISQYVIQTQWKLHSGLAFRKQNHNITPWNEDTYYGGILLKKLRMEEDLEPIIDNGEYVSVSMYVLDASSTAHANVLLRS